MSAAPSNRCPAPLSNALTDALGTIPEPTTPDAVVRTEWVARTQPSAQAHRVPHLAQIVWFVMYSTSARVSTHPGSREFREEVHAYTDAKHLPRLTRREIARGVSTLRDRGMLPPWCVTPRFMSEM